LAELAGEAELRSTRSSRSCATRSTRFSLDEPVRDDGDAELGDFVEDRNATAPFDAAAVSLLPGEVAKVLKVLDERERTILCLRFGLDGGGERTLEEVAEHFGLTRERIRQIEARAMSKLRHPRPTSAPASSSKPSNPTSRRCRPAALRGGRSASGPLDTTSQAGNVALKVW